MSSMSEDRGFWAGIWDAANDLSIRESEGPLTTPRPPEYKICVDGECYESREEAEAAFAKSIRDTFQIQEARR
jgi:hypothetical protein